MNNHERYLLSPVFDAMEDEEWLDIRQWKRRHYKAMWIYARPYLGFWKSCILLTKIWWNGKILKKGSDLNG